MRMAAPGDSLPNHPEQYTQNSVVGDLRTLGKVAVELINKGALADGEVDSITDIAERLLDAVNNYHGAGSFELPIPNDLLPKIEFAPDLPDIIMVSLQEAKRGLTLEEIIIIVSGGYEKIHPHSMSMLQLTLQKLALDGKAGFHDETHRWYRREIYNNLKGASSRKKRSSKAKPAIPQYEGPRSKQGMNNGNGLRTK